jgi:hypothetical protein
MHASIEKHADFFAALKKQLPRVEFKIRLMESTACEGGDSSDEERLTVFAPPSSERQLVSAPE